MTLEVLEISANEHAALMKLAQAHVGQAWNHDSATSPLSQVDRDLVARFKSRLKEHLFYVAQGRYCCYCGLELQAHKATFDLEHVIAKDGRANVVFVLKNLALSCKPCNISKSKRACTVTPSGEDEDVVQDNSESYAIVHPHHDEWSEHLTVDKYECVVAIAESQKGRKTIELCGIEKLNALRLSDHFEWPRQSVTRARGWQEFYVTLCSTEPSSDPQFVEFATNLLGFAGDPAAAPLFELLHDQLQRHGLLPASTVDTDAS